MNILFIAHEDSVFGASKSLLNIVDEFKGKHCCYVVTRSLEGEMSKELRKRDITIIPAKYYTWEIYKNPSKFDFVWTSHCIFWRLFGYFIDCIAAIKIKKALKVQIDIIHVNSGVVHLGVEVKKKLQKPLIWHLREFGYEDFGYVPYLPEKKYYSEIDKADGIIAISDAVMDKFKPHLRKTTIRRIYNGVGKENIIEDKKYHILNNEKMILLIAGSKIAKAKGQGTAIEAIRHLSKIGINNVELWIAGRGDIKDIGITDLPVNVKILGHVKNLTVVRQYVDVELVCSRCEAFGRVTIEAMLGAIPVIGANTGGTIELIQDGENGFIFEHGNQKELANKIKTFYENRELLPTMGKKAQIYAIKNFLIERCANEIEDFYSYILKENI